MSKPKAKKVEQPQVEPVVAPEPEPTRIEGTDENGRRFIKEKSWFSGNWVTTYLT